MRILLILLFAICAGPAFACGQDSDCRVDGGSYRVMIPDADPRGVILFFHGWQGTAAQFMGSSGFMRRAREAGLAVAAPQGIRKSWSFPGSPSDDRDEFAFVDAVVADLGARHGLPVDRILVSGFSLGGSMAWSLACERGGMFAGFAPIAGAYWEPLPGDCPSPVPMLFHVHGTADRTVPLEGRAIGRGYRQGDVHASLSRWRAQGACAADASTAQIDGQLQCERWSACGGGVLELCLHDGGHSIRTEWVFRAWDRLAALKGWR